MIVYVRIHMRDVTASYTAFREKKPLSTEVTLTFPQIAFTD